MFFARDKDVATMKRLCAKRHGWMRMAVRPSRALPRFMLLMGRLRQLFQRSIHGVEDLNTFSVTTFSSTLQWL